MICFETTKELELVLSRVIANKEKAPEIAKAIWQEKEKIEQLQKMAVESLSAESLRYLQEWRASRIKKQHRRVGKKKVAVQIRYFGEIHQLRQDGYSFAEISDYLARYHKLKINPATVFKYYREQLSLLKQVQTQGGDTSD